MENRSKQDWINYAVENAYNLDWEKDIPKQFIDDDLVGKVVYAHPAVIKSIPEKYLNQKVCDEYARGIYGVGHCLKFLPKNFNNVETWGMYLSHNNSDFYDLPLEFQTQRVWDMAISFNPGIIPQVPSIYQTQEMWDFFAKKYPYEINYIPKKFKSKQVWQQCAKIGYINEIPKEFQTQEMWDEFAKKNPYEINRVPEEFQTQEMWNMFASRHPKKITLIPRKFQTQEMWNNKKDAFLLQVPVEFRQIFINYKSHKSNVSKEEFKNACKILIEQEQEYLKIVKNDFRLIHRVPEEFQSQEMWNIYIKNSINDVSEVPKYFQTQDMWNEFAKRNPSEVSHILDDFGNYFMNQDIWNIYAKYEPNKIRNVPRSYQTQDMWNEFAKRNLYSLEIINIPKNFQTQDMWNEFAKRNPSEIRCVPDEFKNEEYWHLIVKKNSTNLKEIRRMPKQFLTSEIILDCVKSGLDIIDFPKTLMTTEIFEAMHIEIDEKSFSRKNFIYDFENIIPKELLSQKLCDKYAEEKYYDYNEIKNRIPKKYQTREMWISAFENNVRQADIILINYMPQEYQTQDMWNKVARDFGFTENNLKWVPNRFVEGVKETIYKREHQEEPKQGVDKSKESKLEATVKNSEETKINKEEVEVKSTEKDSQKVKNQNEDKKDSVEIVAQLQEKCNAKLTVVKNFAKLSQDMLKNAKEQDSIIFGQRKNLKDDLQKLKEMIDDTYKTKHNYAATLQYLNDYELQMKQFYVELCEKLNSPKYFDEKTIKVNTINAANVKKNLEGNCGKKSQKNVKKYEMNGKNEENVIKNSENDIKEDNIITVEQSIKSDKKQEEFNLLLEKFSKVHISYYDGNKGTKGNAHTKEEISEKLKVNRAMKKAIEKRAADLLVSEESKEEGLFDKLINSVDDKTISEVAENQAAALKLMHIMTSGVYEKCEVRTRLTQKQRVALASTMQKVTELMLKNEKKQEKNSAAENQASAME